MRRAALALPQALCDRLANIAGPLETKAVLDEAVRGLLSEVQELPTRIDAAEWAKFLAEHIDDNSAPPESAERPAKAKASRRRRDSRK
jgi:hypothetical protein